MSASLRGELYMLQATDPHGNVWLPGTVDGTTTGRLYDPNLDPPDSPAVGHLWTTDVTSGFCRVVPTDPTTGALGRGATDVGDGARVGGGDGVGGDGARGGGGADLGGGGRGR